MDALAEAAGDLLDTPEGRRAYDAAWVLTFLNGAQQALVGSSPRAGEVIADARRRLTWPRLRATAGPAPVYAAAGALLALGALA